MIYQKFNVDALTNFIVFTDINLDQLEGNITIDDNVVFQCFTNKENPFDQLINFLSNLNSSFIIKKVLLLFLHCEIDLKDIERALMKCKEKLNPDYYVIGLRNVTDFFFQNDCSHLAEEYNIDILCVEEEMENGEDLFNFINHLFLEKLPSIIYYRNSTLNYLKARFQPDAAVSEEDDGFVISNGQHAVRFKNFDFKIFSVCDLNNNLNSSHLMIVTNAHLFGLYSFEKLILLIKCLHEIREKVDIRIEHDEVVLTHSLPNVKLDIPLFSHNLITKLDHLSSSAKKFKIQFFSENYLIFNRCLKVSFHVLQYLLQNDAIVSIIDLAFKYFHCFSIAPICCRMQSLAFDATVFDFDKFTYLHIDKHRSLYIKMCKLFYPFIDDVDETLLCRKYLEVIPVTLIERFHGHKLEAFIEKLQNLVNMNIHIFPLSNGNFQIGSHFNASAEMISKPFDLEKIKNAVRSLELYSNPSFLLCALHECLEFESKVIYEVKNTNMINNDILKELQHHNSNATEIYAILAHEQHQILALQIKCDELPLEIDKVVTNACKDFSEAFDVNVKFSLLPFYKFNLIILKEFLFKNIRIGYFNNGYAYCLQQVNDNDKFWIFKERFYFSRPFPLPVINSIVNDMLSFENDEGICLALIKNKIVTVENMDITINELDPDYYKANADYCYYNENDILKFLKKLLALSGTSALNDLFFEITSSGAIKFLNCVEIYPSIFLRINNIAKLLKIIKEVGALCDKELHRKHSLSNILEMNVTSNSTEHTVASIIRLAKLLNPRLNIIVDKDIFQKLPLICIPEMFYRFPNVTKVCETLEGLRNKNVKIRVHSDRERFLFDYLDGKDLFTAIPNIHRFLEIVEEINSSFDGIILINEMFSVVDYDSYEKKVFFTYDHNQNITKEQLLECLEIFEQNSVKNVAIIDNRYFHISTVIYVTASDLLKLKLSDEHLKLFFEAVNILVEQRAAENVFLSNFCLSIAKENNVIDQVKINRKFQNFTIVDDNKDTYLKLAATFNDCLSGCADILHKYQWFAALPRQMLINKEDAAKLLGYLNYIKEKKFQIMCFNNLIVSNCDIPISKWLAIKDKDKLVTALRVMEKLNIFKNDNKIFSLFFSGLLSFNPRSENTMTNLTSEHQKMIEKCVSSCLNFMKEKGTYLPITLNSGSNIRIGNFIWLFVNELEPVQIDLFEFIFNYEMAIKEEERDVMRSICELAEKEKAISLP